MLGKNWFIKLWLFGGALYFVVCQIFKDLGKKNWESWCLLLNKYIFCKKNEQFNQANSRHDYMLKYVTYNWKYKVSLKNQERQF